MLGSLLWLIGYAKVMMQLYSINQELLEIELIKNASWGGREFQVVDTGGLVFEDDSEFLPEIRTQVFLALEEASLALFVVDGNQGVTDGDLSIAKMAEEFSL